jgi:DNA-directed RNA polymerase subunit alpha
MQPFLNFGRVPQMAAEPEAEPGEARLYELLLRPIDECGLSVRSINSLKNSSIGTLGDLVRYSEDDLLKVKNVGEKALSEIAELLRREQLNFGMAFDERDGQIIVTNAGRAPAMVAAPTDAGVEE